MTARDPREGAWRRFIETSTRLSTAVDDQLRREAGMSLADYHVLLLLSEAPGRRLRMKDLAERMVFSASRLSYQIDVLCRRGWVRRERAADDRRGSFAVLTDAGVSAFGQAAVDHLAQVRRLFIDALTPEDGAALAGLLSRLDAHLDAVLPD